MSGVYDVYDVSDLASILNQEVRYVEVPTPIFLIPLVVDQGHFSAGSPPSNTSFSPSSSPYLPPLFSPLTFQFNLHSIIGGIPILATFQFN